MTYFNENNKSPDRINAETLHEALGDINLTEGETKSLNWLCGWEPSTVKNIVSAFKKAGQSQAIQIPKRPINIGDTLYFEVSTNRWIQGHVSDKAVQNNTTHFYLQSDRFCCWKNENDLGKTVLTPDEYKLKNSISPEREAELHELFWSETNENWTQEWRDSLNEQEQKLVDKWDADCAKGVKAIGEKILDLGKSPPAPQMF